jgi:iron complex outermembrane receptor protein
LWDAFDSRVWAVFGNLAYDVTPDLEAGFALRFDHEERQVSNLVPPAARTQDVDFSPADGVTGGAPLNPGLDPAINPDGVADREADFEQLQPKVSLRWDATPDLTLFGSWGIGFRSGGFNNLGSAATVDLFINNAIGTSIELSDGFDKEVISAFEAGFTSGWWDGRVSVNGAVYYMDVEDMQFHEFFVGPFGLVRVTTNIDEVGILGGELALQVTPVEGLSFFSGFNYTDSEIQKNRTRPSTVGNTSPATPDYTFNAGGQWTHPLTDGLDLFARADYRLTGPTEFHTVQDQVVPTVFGPPADMSTQGRAAYGLLDLRLGVEAQRWRVIAFVENALDRTFLIEAFPAPEFGGTFVAPGTQRRVGVEAAVRF